MKSLLLQQLRTAREEASELLHKTSVPAEKLEGIKQHPESLEEIDSSQISPNQYFKGRQETNKVISRKLMRLKPEERNTSLSSCGGNGADIEKENKMELEKVQNSGNTLESPLTTTELPRYQIGKAVSGFDYGLFNCLRLKKVTYPLCTLEQKGVWFCHLEDSLSWQLLHKALEAARPRSENWPGTRHATALLTVPLASFYPIQEEDNLV